MTTYTDEVSIYNAEAIQDGIDGAAETATNYITTVTNDGIMVADAGSGASSGSITSSTTGWHLGGVLEYIRNGISRFWIGLKNQNDTSPTVRIGKKYVNGATDNESYMELDYHSLQLIDKEGDTYFYVSDLRDQNGKITETWVADGITRAYNLMTNSAQSNYNVYIDDVEVTSGVTKNISKFAFDTAPSESSIVKAYYRGSSTETKAYTFGKRNATGKIGLLSVAEGYETVAGKWAHAEGYGSKAAGSVSHSEGQGTSASGSYSHAEGEETRAGAQASHAEGYNTKANGIDSHAEGSGSIASGNYGSHAEGYETTASNTYGSHAEGWLSNASGQYGSHAEGANTQAVGDSSHAQNEGTIAAKISQTALGTFNIEDTATTTTHPYGISGNGKYAVIIGNGMGQNNRANALGIEWNGRAELWHPEIIRGTAPQSSIYGGGGAVQLVDKSGDQIGYLQPYQTASGEEGVQLGVGNSDDSDYNVVSLGFDASDNPTVSVTDSAEWRSAIGAAATSHSHSAGDITSGTLPIARGGTGTSNYLSGGVMDKINTTTNLSTSTGTWKSGSSSSNPDSFTLSAGTYIAVIHTEWASNTSGSRMHCLTTTNPWSSGFSTPDNSTSTQMQAANGTVRMTSMAFLSPSSSTTYYLGLYQNSGGSLNCSARRVRVIQLA